MSDMSLQPTASLDSRHRYLPHVDGLRAIAVISVLLYHLDMTFISGGFVGVDVFFVISGYLITSHIRQAIQCKRFTFRKFYMKRARRLLPALLVTLLATLLAGYFILPAANYQALGRESLFSLLSASNILFWLQSGYFDSASDLKPLLHTWSLSVEEQFYLIWPLLLVFFASERRALQLLLTLGLLSLVAAQYWLSKEPALVFFMMPFRIVEFALGAMLFWLERTVRPAPFVRELLSLIGLALIAASLLLINNTTLFPGLWALPVCLGTALVIFCAAGTQIGRILSLSPVRYLGMISYSLYLVHWPLIVFYKYINLAALTWQDQLLLMSLSIALASLMYHLVETPFRRSQGRMGFSPRQAGVSMVVTAALVAGVSAHVVARDGLPWRFHFEQLSADDIEAGKSARYDIIQPLCEQRGWERCREPSADKDRNVLVIGDSYGIDGLNILAQAFPDYHYTSVSQGGCPPLVNADMAIIEPTWPDRKACVELNDKRLSAAFLADYRAIAISVQFDWYKPEHLRRVVKHIRQATDAPVIVFGSFVHLNRPMADLHNKQIDPRSRPAAIKSLAAYEQKLAKDEAHGYIFISKRQLFCAGEGIGSCKLYFDGVPFTYDESHLSLEASAFAARQLQQQYIGGLEQLMNRRP